MKRLLLAMPLVFMACSFPKTPQGESVDKLDGYIPDHVNRLKVEMMSDEIAKGLYKIIIDDTVHILLYRGVESVTMIQVK